MRVQRNITIPPEFARYQKYLETVAEWRVIMTLYISAAYSQTWSLTYPVMVLTKSTGLSSDELKNTLEKLRSIGLIDELWFYRETIEYVGLVLPKPASAPERTTPFVKRNEIHKHVRPLE